MVINSDSDDSTTAKQNDDQKPRNRYRPQFLEHFDRKNTGDARGDEKSMATEYFTPAAGTSTSSRNKQQTSPYSKCSAATATTANNNNKQQQQQQQQGAPVSHQQHTQQQQQQQSSNISSSNSWKSLRL